MYFVSTREENRHKDLFGGAWGYYWDKASAVDAVHRTVTDIHETIYPYAIVECPKYLRIILHRHIIWSHSCNDAVLLGNYRKSVVFRKILRYNLGRRYSMKLDFDDYDILSIR